MLKVGLPVDAHGQHNATPLHWAAWHGNVEMVNSLLEYSPPLEDATNDFHATPLGWATHGSEHGWYCKRGNYPAVVEALLQAGAKLLEKPEGSEPVNVDHCVLITFRLGGPVLFQVISKECKFHRWLLFVARNDGVQVLIMVE